jgi:hypothetical protein
MLKNCSFHKKTKNKKKRDCNNKNNNAYSNNCRLLVVQYPRTWNSHPTNKHYKENLPIL